MHCVVDYGWNGWTYQEVSEHLSENSELDLSPKELKWNTTIEMHVFKVISIKFSTKIVVYKRFKSVEKFKCLRLLCKWNKIGKLPLMPGHSRSVNY